ncbi:MAG: SdpI family protein [Eubacteriales bacterium]
MKLILKENKWKLILTSLLMLLPTLAGLILWDKLPDRIPIHFGADGKADGWSSRLFAVFGLPLIILAFHWLCVIGTSFDPKKQNINRKLFSIVLWICPVISLVLVSVCYAYVMGWEINVAILIFLLCGLLFIILGNYLPKCRQSYTMGIKLPWTLADEANWNATHRLGGWLWVAGGLLLLVSAPLTSIPIVAVCVFIGDVFLMMLIPTVYSFLYFKKHSDRKE